MTTEKRLERGFWTLSLLDTLRLQSGSPDLGRSLERLILDRELRAVEVSTALAESAADDAPAPAKRAARRRGAGSR